MFTRKDIYFIKSPTEKLEETYQNRSVGRNMVDPYDLRRLPRLSSSLLLEEEVISLVEKWRINDYVAKVPKHGNKTIIIC
jgi:hypothetical protein